jgi:hypothetical protein
MREIRAPNSLSMEVISLQSVPLWGVVEVLRFDTRRGREAYLHGVEMHVVTSPRNRTTPSTSGAIHT